MLRILFFIFALFVCGKSSTALSPINKLIRLAFGVSKATYLPLQGSRFLQAGHIMGRKKSNKLPYYDAKEKIVCSVGGWQAKSYEKDETELILFTHSKQKLAVLGFRGTESSNLVDWQKNFKVKLVDTRIGSKSVKLHEGFGDRYQDISAWFERNYRDIPRDYTIMLTGHSLGGALAIVAAAYAVHRLRRRPDSVITFASPFVGDEAFRKYYTEMVGCDRTLRITNKGDIITSVAFDQRYTHVCKALHLNGHFGWLSVLNPLKSHSLYAGYDQGLAKKFANVNEINFGCDKLI